MLDSVGADGRTDLTRVAKQVAQGIPRRGLVIIISDLLGVDNLMDGFVSCDSEDTTLHCFTYFMTMKWTSNSTVQPGLRGWKRKNS